MNKLIITWATGPHTVLTGHRWGDVGGALFETSVITEHNLRQTGKVHTELVVRVR